MKFKIITNLKNSDAGTLEFLVKNSKENVFLASIDATDIDELEAEIEENNTTLQHLFGVAKIYRNTKPKDIHYFYEINECDAIDLENLKESAKLKQNQDFIFNKKGR